MYIYICIYIYIYVYITGLRAKHGASGMSVRDATVSAVLHKSGTTMVFRQPHQRRLCGFVERGYTRLLAANGSVGCCCQRRPGGYLLLL